jgi:type IV secretion system protein VirB10
MENTNATATEPAGTERIVSVNDYGRTGINSWHRIARVALIVAVLSAAVAMSVHRAKAYIRAKSAPQIQEQRQATTAEAQPGRRTFPASAIPTAPAATSPATPAAAKLSDIQGCADGQPSEPMKAQDGTLILTPTGQPVRVCHDGQILIPPLPMPAQQPQPTYQAHAASQSAGTATAAAPVATKRDDGDIVLPQRDAGLSNNGPHTAQATASGQFAARALTDSDARDAADGATGSHRSLKSLLRATPTVAVQAQRIGDRNMLLPEGRTIDCNLSLRVISEVSGMAVCVLSSYVYGDTGVVVLAEPGSVATGDYIAFSEQGQRRLFITWSRLKTTSGVIININSPASDALGTSGVEGYVDNRWADRIGAAVLLSSVKDVIGYQTARAGADRDNSGGVNVFPNTTEAGSRLAERILESTINIKPTIYKNQGDRASITVRRDLDFGSVYVLQSK